MEPFIGQLALFPFGFAPKGWMLCNGQLLQISQYPALFSLLGTAYGGDGIRTFALPNLQGRVPMGANKSMNLGQSGGENTHTLSSAELPMHNHLLMASSNPASATSPGGNVFAATSGKGYGTGARVALDPRIIPSAGGSQPHENRQPFTVLSYCIAVVGIFPSQN